MSKGFFRLGTGVAKLFSMCWLLFRQGLRFLLPVLLGYLLQVSVVPYMTLITGRGIMPNLLVAILSVLVVAKGGLQAFWASCFYGMVTELMMSTAPLFSLVYYPVLTFFASLFLADKSEDRMTRERNARGEVKLIHPYLRTLFAALFFTIVREAFLLVYTLIQGYLITPDRISHAVFNTLLTCSLTMLIMLPYRKWLGVVHVRRSKLPEYTMQPLR